MRSLHHKKAGALNVESSHFDKPGERKERDRGKDRQKMREEVEREMRSG